MERAADAADTGTAGRHNGRADSDGQKMLLPVKNHNCRAFFASAD